MIGLQGTPKQPPISRVPVLFFFFSHPQLRLATADHVWGHGGVLLL